MIASHWEFIAVAYGLSALALAVEWLVLRARRRQALARAARDQDTDDTAMAGD